MPSFYNFCWYFLIFSVIGWAMETALVSFQQKKFVNRGFLSGPLCPIYGVGMCLIILAMSAVRVFAFKEGRPPVYSFAIMLVVGGIIACAVEYFVGWLLEKLFHQRWWDYSDHRFNINGRIAIPESLAWGPLATAAMLWFIPWLDSLIVRLPFVAGCIILGVIAAWTVADAVVILAKMKAFDKLAERLAEGRTELLARLNEGGENLRERLAEGGENLREMLSESGENLREKSEEWRAEFAEGMAALREKWQKPRGKLHASLERRLHRRIRGAYPKLAEKWRILRDDDADETDD